MKFMQQLSIILGISLLGEVIHAMVPLPFPASIYGLVLMLAALCTGLIPLSRVKETGKFLVEIMPLLFIPLTVGMMDSWPVLRSILLPFAAIVLLTTVVVMAVSGRVTQWAIRKGERR